MPTEDEGSVTYWLSELKAGTPTAAQPLWDRYFDPLVRLARTKLRATHRGGTDADEEDAAVSPSTTSAAASPRAGSRNWPIATTCGGCW